MALFGEDNWKYVNYDKAISTRPTLDGDEFLLAYSFTGKEFALDTSKYFGKDIWIFRPATGIYSFYGSVERETIEYKEIPSFNEDTDVVVVIK